MNTLEFIHLHPTGLNCCSMDKVARAEAARTWLCKGCGTPKPGVCAVDLQIQEVRPDPAPLTFVSGCGIALARRDFLEALGSERVQTDLMLGTVTGPSGEVIPDWLTVRGRRRLIVRGSKHVSYRRCEFCGRHVYFAMGTRYLFPAPDLAASIFESDLSLVVIPDVLKEVSLGRWPKLGIERLKVLHKPKDSLGDLLQAV